MSGVVWGPTYEEMFDPSLLPKDVQQEARREDDDLSPAGLYRITWRDERGRVRAIRLAPELTGVDANILVLIGKHFPSGSHKVGAAYAALMEAELDGRVMPGEVTLVAPSTGNFALGVTQVARIKGYRSLVVMPEGVGTDRCERICSAGAELDLTSGSEGDLVAMLEHTRNRYSSDPAYGVLEQFELFANYRFHRHVTGRSAIEAAAGFGDGRVAAFVSAPGSAGTLAAGDAIKAQYGDALVAAVEPAECPYLFEGRRGSHHVGGVADGLVTLVHNVLNTDYVLLVSEEDCLRGLRVIQEGAAVLTRVLGVSEAAAQSLADLFGVSSICNILGAIKLARALRIPAGRNIVTVATDGFDRYPAVLAEYEKAADLVTLRLWAGHVFRDMETKGILDVRPVEQKERLFRQKDELWHRFGYSDEALEAMHALAFWEEEYAKVVDYDRRLREARGF